MKAFNQTLQDTLHSANQYIIPVFQRYYSWEKKDWEKLWSDLDEIYTSGPSTHRHFMGSLVFVPENHYTNMVPAYQVIDGQQRLITTSLLLCALRNLAVSNGFNELAAEINENYLVHRFKKGREHYRVYPRQRDRDHYINILEQKDQPGGQAAQALAYFSSQIQNLETGLTEESLRSFFNLLQTGLEFVHIILEGENPYRIFRSLNSTGVDLNEADLIRNFVFMQVPIDQQDNFDDNYWKPLEKHFETPAGELDGNALSGFFRDFLMTSGKYISPETTFENFEKRYTVPGFDPFDLINELNIYVNHYDIIRGRKPHPDPTVNQALSRLRSLETTTTYPLLLLLLDLTRQGVIPNSELAGCFNLLSGFIFRRFVYGETSRAYSRLFVSLINYARTNPLKGIKKYIQERGYTFPDDPTFIAAFVRLNLYGTRYCLSTLQALETFYPHKEPVDLANVQIEHIMPQTLGKQWSADLGPDFMRVYATWIHTPGNLTLTGYNQELSNKPFSEKRQEYQKSNITMTRALSNYSAWTEAEIIERANILAQEAAKIWLGPDA